MSTSAKSKKSNKRTPDVAKNRPFAPAIVRKAAVLVPQYQVIVQWDKELESYFGRCIEIPNAIGEGKNEAACIEEVRGNINALVLYMLEIGETPPLADEPERKAQVNVRFADYEKATAEALAKAAGKTLSDYIRVSALRGV